MPHAVSPDPADQYKHIRVHELHPTFGAEVSGVDFSKSISPEVFAEIHKAITEKGVLVFREAGLDDTRHVEFARLFGELDDIKPYLAAGRKNRFAYDELFDVSNLEDDGSIVQIDSQRDHMGRGNGLFHVDSAFNPRRAGFSLLRAHELPPPGTGGATEFADTRTAFDDLPSALKTQLSSADYIGAHSLWHSRKLACPDSPHLAHIDPTTYPYGRHRIVQRHESSGRMNLYIASHLHHLETMHDKTPVPIPAAESAQLIRRLLEHATQPVYTLAVAWKEPGDLVVWDNTAVMHRAGPGTFFGKFKRDMRRCTVHDGSGSAWGLNERSTKRMGMP